MTYEIYPNSTPEFCTFQKTDGTVEMKIRYINKIVGYTGKWMTIKTEKENNTMFVNVIDENKVS